MSRRIPFTKMHGLGNDFIVIDGVKEVPTADLTPDLARQMCDRRFGIGADQILWLRPSQTEDVRMDILNADGSTAEMCGNGIRAVALFLQKYGTAKKKTYRVETLAGTKIVDIQQDQTVTVDMGAPVLGERFSGEPLSVSGETVTFHEVSMGNPHAIIFVPELGRVPFEKLGPAIEIHPRFPKKTNVEFVQVLGPDAIRVKVWERGAGPTLACGTGACAAAVATIATGRAKGPLKVELPGGDLEIAWEGQGKPVFMTGPATEVFRGEYYPRS